MFLKFFVRRSSMSEQKRMSMEQHPKHDVDAVSNASYDSLPMKDFNDQEVPFLGSKQLHKHRSRLGKVWLWFAHMLLLATSVTIMVFSLTRTPTDEECDRVLSPYSPALEAIEYETYMFQNNFSQPSIYRGPPTPEREAAWEHLTHGPAINVPMDKLHLLNKSTDVDWVRTPAEAGGGAAALLEVVHQLHCVSLLRKWSYRKWYEEAPPEFDGPEYLMRMHIDHCIEILRVHLMCASDVTPFLSVIDPAAPIGKRADFESLHKCRNFWKMNG